MGEGVLELQTAERLGVPGGERPPLDGVAVEAEVEVEGGRARVRGDHVVAGVPGTGSPVVTRYLDPGGGVLGAGHRPREHPTDIGVDDRAWVAEGEGGDGGRGVRPDTGQGKEVVVVAGDLAGVPLDHDAGGLPQPQCAARVAKAVPHAHRLPG